MRLPDRPRLGLVLRYSYLWTAESEAGRQEGSKDRPVVVVLARKDLGPSEIVYVVPITHSPASEENKKIPVPAIVQRHLGLDDGASWIDATELNVFAWPGPDFRPIKRERGGGNDSPCYYGVVPRGLFKKIQRVLALNHKLRRVQLVTRSV